jgi:hypothetical protein
MTLRSSAAATLRAFLPRRWIDRLTRAVVRVAGEVREARDYATPADVRAAAQHVSHARTALDELSLELASLRPTVEALRRVLADRPAPVPRAQALAALRSAEVDMLTGALDSAASELVSLRAQAAAVDARLAAAVDLATAVPVAPLVADVAAPYVAAAATCRVPDCESKVRAKGFCGKHYQQWTRGRLPGFAP